MFVLHNTYMMKFHEINPESHPHPTPLCGLVGPAPFPIFRFLFFHMADFEKSHGATSQSHEGANEIRNVRKYHVTRLLHFDCVMSMPSHHVHHVYDVYGGNVETAVVQ